MGAEPPCTPRDEQLFSLLLEGELLETKLAAISSMTSQVEPLIAGLGRGLLPRAAWSRSPSAAAPEPPLAPARPVRLPGRVRPPSYCRRPWQGSESRERPAYRCAECGWQTAKWVGRCGECQAWGTVAEAGGARGPYDDGRPGQPRPPGRSARSTSRRPGRGRPASPSSTGCSAAAWSPARWCCSPASPASASRRCCSTWPRGSPSAARALYVTGEESAAQVRLRADRIGALRDELFLAAETDLAAVLGHVDAVKPDLLVVDSVQTIASAEVDGVAGRRHPGPRGRRRADPGGQGARHRDRARRPRHQGRLDRRAARCSSTWSTSCCTSRATGTPGCAWCAGSRTATARPTRSAASSCPTTASSGLADPSGLFLSQQREAGARHLRHRHARGQAAAGRRGAGAGRPPSQLNSPRRTTSGLDGGRVAMVLAVLQRRGPGQASATRDVYAATVGGVRLTEPAADLALALALAGRRRSDSPLATGLVAIGEVGLAGEIRRVTGAAAPAGRGRPARLHPRARAARPGQGARRASWPSRSRDLGARAAAWPSRAPR